LQKLDLEWTLIRKNAGGFASQDFGLDCYKGRPFVSPVIKFLLYFPKHWSSCMWSQNPLSVLEQLLPWVWVCLQPLFQRVLGGVESTQSPYTSGNGQWVALLQLLPWAESTPALMWGMGYSLEEGRAMKVCSSSCLGFLWCNKHCIAHSASRPGQGHCDTTTQVQQALRSEAKKTW